MGSAQGKTFSFERCTHNMKVLLLYESPALLGVTQGLAIIVHNFLTSKLKWMHFALYSLVVQRNAHSHHGIGCFGVCLVVHHGLMFMLMASARLHWFNLNALVSNVPWG